MVHISQRKVPLEGGAPSIVTQNGAISLFSASGWPPLKGKRKKEEKDWNNNDNNRKIPSRAWRPSILQECGARQARLPVPFSHPSSALLPSFLPLFFSRSSASVGLFTIIRKSLKDVGRGVLKWKCSSRERDAGGSWPRGAVDLRVAARLSVCWKIRKKILLKSLKKKFLLFCSYISQWFCLFTFSHIGLCNRLSPLSLSQYMK